VKAKSVVWKQILKSNFKKMACHNIVYFTGYPS